MAQRRRAATSHFPPAPFRADHVGSILRSEAIKTARARHEKGELSAGELKAVEDREFIAAIKEKREPNASLAQVLPCMHVLGKLEKIIDPQRKAHA